MALTWSGRETRLGRVHQCIGHGAAFDRERDVDDSLDLRGREHTDRWIGDARRRDDLPGLRSQRRHRRPRATGPVHARHPGPVGVASHDRCRAGPAALGHPERALLGHVRRAGHRSDAGRRTDHGDPVAAPGPRHARRPGGPPLRSRIGDGDRRTANRRRFRGIVRRQGRTREWLERTGHGRRRRRHHHRGRSDRSRRWCGLTGHSLPPTPGIGRGRSAHVAAHPPAR